MKPFLLLSTRPEHEAAEGERLAVASFGGLSEKDLVQFRVEEAPLPPIRLADYSGILLGGGPFNSSDPEKSDLQRRVEADLARVLDEAMDTDMPFLGLCYGVGTVTGHLGGLVDRTYGEPVGAVDLHVTEAGLADPLLAEVGTRFRGFVGHKEAVTQLPASAELLVRGDACPVQMFKVGDNCYVTQFHPELDTAGLIARMTIYKHAGYFDPAELDVLAQRIHDAQLDPAVHSIVRRFVERYATD